jgi:hypothetical protein
MKFVYFVLPFFLATEAPAQEMPVPSGTQMTLFEVLFEQEPVPLARFRFVVPAIAQGAVSFGDLLPDIEYLCGTVAVPALAANGWTTGEIVISLSEQELTFGENAPDITQYFQPFSIQGDACQMEDF